MATQQPADPVHQALDDVREHIHQSVVGLEGATDDLLTAFITQGHVLLEGVPGLAKTTLAKAFSRALNLTFRRIQFTQDLLPADITGHYYFDQADNEFKFRHGPIFSNVILADEINRASAKTQSALLEAMQEGQVTVEGETYRLPQPFFVIATQNPIDVEGVYELPIAQLDRFMLKTRLNYLPHDEERRVLQRELQGTLQREPKTQTSGSVADTLTGAADTVHVDDALVDYILAIAEATRTHEQLRLGASTRASLHLLNATRAHALLEGRDHALPSDTKNVAKQVLAHRLAVSVDAEIENRTALDVLSDILESQDAPAIKPP